MEKPYNIPDVKACMPLMFDHKGLTYDAWRELFETYCMALGLIDHIWDIKEKPVDDDPEWNRMDSIVKLWIFSTINRCYVPSISTKNEAARQVWMNLKSLFREKKTNALNNQLIYIKIGDSSITDYCTRIKTIADRLDNLECLVSENDLVIYTINGLSPKFDYIASIFRCRSPLPSFLETRSMLLLEESRMSQIILLLSHVIMLPHIFFKARILSDLKAAYNFQVIEEGYEVVSYPEKDEAFDENGKSRVLDFGMLFGNNLLEDYIGQLYMSAILEEDGQAPEILKMKVKEGMREFQRERETKLIRILKNRLQPFVKGQTNDFISWATSEARQLSQAPFGETMLHTIGYIYTSQGARELGKDKLYMIPFFTERVRGVGHWRKSDLSASSGVKDLIQIQKELKKLSNSEGKEEQIMKAVEEKKDQIINSLWQIIVVDIETTLSRVCQAVLNDPMVSEDELKGRAIGMKILGEILQGAKKQKGSIVQSVSTSK